MAEPPVETPQERLARYRRLADEARRDAERSQTQELRELYALLARRWDTLADDFERSLKQG